MKKVFIFVLSLFAMCSLAACNQTRQEEISFLQTSFSHFTYKEKSYFVTNTEVSQDDIQKPLYQFYKWLIVDRNNEEVLLSSTSNSVTLAFNNLYQTFDHSICIGINDTYFKVISNDFIDVMDSLSLQRFEKTVSNDDGFKIDEDDSRKIKYEGNVYTISNVSIARNELGSYKSVLAEVRIFNSENGKRIPRSQLGKIDNGGSISKQNRVQWIYGRIYSIKEDSMEEKFAIEINNEFKLVIKEDKDE